MSGKPYTVYEVEGRRKRRWVRVLLWLFAGLVVVALAVAGGSYLWFRHQVGGANARVSKAAVAALKSHPVTTLSSSLLPFPPSKHEHTGLGLRQ